MARDGLRIEGLRGLPEIAPGDDLAALIAAASRRAGLRWRRGDVLVVAHKAVSKAEGQIRLLAGVRPSPRARSWGRRHGKDPRVIELALGESRRVVRMRRGVMICETRQGFICANAGVDVSNAPAGAAILLPRDPDRSAARLRAELRRALGTDVAVIISDSFGRPWREGLVNVALGVAGMAPLRDYRGTRDAGGRPLLVTQMATADAVAAAAELVMGKAAGIPAARVRGADFTAAAGGGQALLRRRQDDLFR